MKTPHQRVHDFIRMFQGTRISTFETEAIVKLIEGAIMDERTQWLNLIQATRETITPRNCTHKIRELEETLRTRNVLNPKPIPHEERNIA